MQFNILFNSTSQRIFYLQSDLFVLIKNFEYGRFILSTTYLVKVSNTMQYFQAQFDRLIYPSECIFYIF